MRVANPRGGAICRDRYFSPFMSIYHEVVIERATSMISLRGMFAVIVYLKPSL